MKKMPVRYIGEARHGYYPDPPLGRALVPRGSNGVLLKRQKGWGCKVRFIINGRKVHFFCPSWELRKLVKK